MKFSFEYYMNNTFIWPLIGCVLFGLISVLILISLIKDKKERDKKERDKKERFDKKSIINIIIFVVFVFGLVCNAIHLSYGYKIPLDKKEDAVIKEGEVLYISKAFGSPLYKLENINTRGYYINISNEKYYIMYTGELEIGDKVEFEYLPNSKVVLSIERINS